MASPLRFLAARLCGITGRQGAVAFFADFWRYGLCSALALALDWSLLLGLVHVGVNYQAAALASFSAGMVCSYLGNIVFVFPERRAYPVLAEAAGFAILGLLGLLINNCLLFVFVTGFGLPVGLAKAPTAIGVFLFNFLTRRMLLFTGRPMIGLAGETATPDAAFDLE